MRVNRPSSPMDLVARREARTVAVEALRLAETDKGNPGALGAAAVAIANLPGGESEGDPVWCYGRLLKALEMAVQWRPAIVLADPQAERYRLAAATLAQEVLASQDHPQARWPKGLAEAAKSLALLKEPREVRQCAALLLAVALPPRLTGLAVRVERIEPPTSCHDPERTSPVLILVSVDGLTDDNPFVLQPGHIYEATVTARVEQWPEEAQAVMVEFLGVLPTNVLELPRTQLTSTTLSATFQLVVHGTLQPAGRIVEYVTRAYFTCEGERTLPARVVGHPFLRLSTFDPSVALPRGLPGVASKIHDMLLHLSNRLPDLSRHQRDDFMLLFDSVLRFANRAIQDGLQTSAPVPESAFQFAVKAHLSADPNIGARYVEHESLGGGISDLGLGDIILELKVEHDKAVALADAHTYLKQPAHYASAKDAPVSILCILDDSAKTAPPGVLANYVEWIEPRLHGLDDPTYPTLVAVVIIPVEFPRPSDWSKAATGPTSARKPSATKRRQSSAKSNRKLR